MNKKEEFVSELNQIELIHLLNLEMLDSVEVKQMFSHQNKSDDDATMAFLLAQMDNPVRIDKILFEIGWGTVSYEMLLKEPDNALAKSLANIWEYKVTEAIAKGDKRVILQSMQRACKNIAIGNKLNEKLQLKVDNIRMPD